MRGRRPKTFEEHQFNQQVGALIANVRRIRKLDHDELAQRAGISRGQLYFWESGEQRVPLYYLKELARILSVPLAALLPGVTAPSLSRK